MVKIECTSQDTRSMQHSPLVRKGIAEKSFQFFFEIYFEHYMTAPFGEFHKEIFQHLEKKEERFITIMAFRGSGKSSIISTAFPIWSILWYMKCKFIVIAAQTQPQARLYMRNLKEELESNVLLKRDLWPFEEDTTEWNNSSLVLSKFWARITVISVDQSTRGIRYKNHRPDLIIADDIENIQSMRTREGRDNLQEWFTKELIPIWDPKKTRLILLGNMLHRDSLLMRIKEGIANGTRSGVFLRYPLIDQKGLCIWPERFTLEEVQSLKMDIGNEIAWKTEYLLEEAWRDGQVVEPWWIHWEDTIPVWWRGEYNIKKMYTWVDLAISEEVRADFTAFVTWAVVGSQGNKKIYIVDALEKKMDFPTTLETTYTYYAQQESILGHAHHLVIVETTAYQIAFLQSLKNIPSEGYKPSCSKLERLTLVTNLIKSGMIIFLRTPKVERLVAQILGFQQEIHDDLVDAFTMMISRTITDKSFNQKNVTVTVI